MKKVLKAVVVTAAATLAVSCASTKVAYTEEEFNQAFAAGDYGTCISMVQSNNDKNSAIVYSLDADMLMHLNGDYLGSAKAFMRTQGDMQQMAKDTSGSKTFAAAIAGENSVKYAGTTYERILAYSMRAANALALGDVSNAKGVMDNYTGDYKDIIAPLVAEQKELAEQSEGCLESEQVTTALDALKKAGIDIGLSSLNSGKPAKSNKQYETSPFLSYLGTVIYAANGDAGHAKDFASALKADNASVDVSEDIAVPAGKGRLDVVALSGTIGKRTEDGSPTNMGMIPLTTIPLVFKIAYPAFGAQNHAISAVRVTLSDGTSKTATPVEDFDKAVETDVAFKARGAYNRSIFRNITKNSATIPASIAAIKSAEELKAKAGSNVIQQKAAEMAYAKAMEGITAGLTAIVDAEKADVRQGSYFPHMASAAGFTVAPGTYSVKVEYLSKSGSVVETKELSDIVVEAGKPTVVVSSCAK